MRTVRKIRAPTSFRDGTVLRGKLTTNKREKKRDDSAGYTDKESAICGVEINFAIFRVIC